MSLLHEERRNFFNEVFFVCKFCSFSFGEFLLLIPIFYNIAESLFREETERRERYLNDG